MSTHTETHHDDHSHGGPKLYAMIFGALLVLTIITVGVSYIHFGSGLANVIIAMGIASIKASLVALFFMHLRWDKPFNAVIFCGSLFFLGLFLMTSYTDWSSILRAEPTNLKSRNIPGGQIVEPIPGAAPPAVAAPKPAAAAPAAAH